MEVTGALDLVRPDQAGIDDAGQKIEHTGVEAVDHLKVGVDRRFQLREI